MFHLHLDGSSWKYFPALICEAFLAVTEKRILAGDGHSGGQGAGQKPSLQRASKVRDVVKTVNGKTQGNLNNLELGQKSPNWNPLPYRE